MQYLQQCDELEIKYNGDWDKVYSDPEFISFDKETKALEYDLFKMYTDNKIWKE